MQALGGRGDIASSRSWLQH